MCSIGIDLGGTKISSAIFSREGSVLTKDLVYLENRGGREAGGLIQEQVINLLNYARENNLQINGVGISVPGIYYPQTGRVWAPNIAGWEDYPLKDDVLSVTGDLKINVKIDNDRACSLLGEVWKGKAKGCRNVVSLLVGTGIGAGIMADGEIINGQNGAAGAVGWLALDRPFRKEYSDVVVLNTGLQGTGLQL